MKIEIIGPVKTCKTCKQERLISDFKREHLTCNKCYNDRLVQKEQGKKQELFSEYKEFIGFF